MPEFTEAQARQLWLAGRYCIGCQSLNVATNPQGYCAACIAAYDARFAASVARGATVHTTGDGAIAYTVEIAKVCTCNKVPCECPD